MTREQAVVKLKLSKQPLTGFASHQYLQQIRKQQQMFRFKNFLRWFNNKDNVATLGAMQNMIAFHHDKNNDILKLGRALPNLANICLHKSTDTKFYLFTEADKNQLKKIQ